MTSYGIAVALGTLQDIAHVVPSSIPLGYLAGSFALWASVSEGKTTRPESSRDLVLLCLSAALGAALFAVFAEPLRVAGRAAPELILVTGAFLVGYLKQFGILGAGVGSQIYIGELLGYGARLTANDLRAVGIAALIAALASVVPRMLSGPAERPVATVLFKEHGEWQFESFDIRHRGSGRAFPRMVFLRAATLGSGSISCRRSVWSPRASAIRSRRNSVSTMISR